MIASSMAEWVKAPVCFSTRAGRGFNPWQVQFLDISLYFCYCVQCFFKKPLVKEKGQKQHFYFSRQSHRHRMFCCSKTSRTFHSAVAAGAETAKTTPPAKVSASSCHHVVSGSPTPQQHSCQYNFSLLSHGDGRKYFEAMEN